MPSNDGALKEIKAVVTAVQENVKVIESEKVSITEAFDELHAKYGIPRRVFNFLVRAMYYGNQEATFEKNDELREAWDKLENV
jgi:hypothetical protein